MRISPYVASAFVGGNCSMAFGAWLDMPWYAQAALAVMLTLNVLFVFTFTRR
jgi:hypothetical protein